MNVKELFHPVAVSDIREAADRNELVHFRRGAASSCQSLMNWDIAAHIAERKGCQLGELRILSDGVAVPQPMLKASKSSAQYSGAALRRLARQGVSFVAAGIEDFSPGLRDLRFDAERHFGCPVTLGLIATFGKGHALKPHWDPEDIICIQIAGRKTWKILGKPYDGKIAVTDRKLAPPTEVTREFTMEQGDLMMVPRGYWHCCESDVDNLQFSILLQRRMGLDFIRALANKLIEDPLFHRAIPLTRDPGQFAVLEAEWLARFRELASAGSLMRFVESDDRSMEIPFCFDRTPPAACNPDAHLTLATRRPIGRPKAPGEPLLMGGVVLNTTPALLAVVELLNGEISLPASEVFDRLASYFTRDEIAAAIVALDESCLARLWKP